MLDLRRVVRCGKQSTCQNLFSETTEHNSSSNTDIMLNMRIRMHAVSRMFANRQWTKSFELIMQVFWKQ